MATEGFIFYYFEGVFSLTFFSVAVTVATEVVEVEEEEIETEFHPTKRQEYNTTMVNKAVLRSQTINNHSLTKKILRKVLLITSQTTTIRPSQI